MWRDRRKYRKPRCRATFSRSVQSGQSPLSTVRLTDVVVCTYAGPSVQKHLSGYRATAGVGRRTWLVTVWRKKWGTSVSRVAISVRRCLCPSCLCRSPCELDATSVARSTRRCRGGKTMCHTVSSSSGAFVELGRMQSGVGECVNTIYCDDRSTEANTRLKRDHDRIREIVKGYGG